MVKMGYTCAHSHKILQTAQKAYHGHISGEKIQIKVGISKAVSSWWPSTPLFDVQSAGAGVP